MPGREAAHRVSRLREQIKRLDRSISSEAVDVSPQRNVKNEDSESARFNVPMIRNLSFSGKDNQTRRIHIPLIFFPLYDATRSS